MTAPLAREGSVRKADVIARLCTSRLPFVSVVAPAGYGKTTLLARWAEADRRAFAWVALDGRARRRRRVPAVHRGRDSSRRAAPARGVRRVVRPRRRRPGQRAFRDWGALWPGSSGHWCWCSTICMRSPIPSCLDALAELVEYVPAGSQIAVASREEPALPLARWRAHGLVHEVGVPDLRLDEREAGLLLDAAGVELDAKRAIGAEPSGRRVGRRACISRRCRCRPGRRARRPRRPSPATTGSSRTTSARSCSPGCRRSRRGSSSTPRCWIACAAACATRCCRRPGRRTRSTTLERRNCFVVPLDRRGEWYRYHHLFGELLRNELERSEPDLARALNGRAMDWCIANDLTEAAVVYGHAAGETDTVAGAGRRARAAAVLRRPDGDRGGVAGVVQR